MDGTTQEEPSSGLKLHTNPSYKYTQATNTTIKYHCSCSKVETQSQRHNQWKLVDLEAGLTGFLP